MELHVLVISILVATAKVAEHRNAGLRWWLELGDFKRRADEPVHLACVPLELALRAGPRRPNSTQFGEERVTGIGFEQPCERLRTFGVCLGKQLDHRDGELPVDQILSSASGSNAPNVREGRGFPKRLLGEEGWAAAWLFGSGFRAHFPMDRR